MLYDIYDKKGCFHKQIMYVLKSSRVLFKIRQLSNRLETDSYSTQFQGG